MKSSPAEHGRRDIAGALDGVAPAAVCVLMLGQPIQPAGDEFLVILVETGILVDQGQGADGRRRGQGGRRKLAGPETIRIAFGKKGGKSGLVGAFQPRWIDGGHQEFSQSSRSKKAYNAQVRASPWAKQTCWNSMRCLLGIAFGIIVLVLDP